MNREFLFSVSPDAGNVLDIIAGRYLKNKDAADDNLYVKAYSGDPVDVDRISRQSFSLNEPIMAIFWLTQPMRIAKLLGNEQLRKGGLLPRFLLWDTQLEPIDIPPERKPIPESVRERYHKRIFDLINAYQQNSNTSTIPDSPVVNEEIRLFHNLQVQARRTKWRDINPFVARWHENGWRLMVVLHAAKFGEMAHLQPVELNTVQNALKIIRWFAGLIPEKWTVEKCSSAQVKGAEGNEEKSVQ